MLKKSYDINMYIITSARQKMRNGNKSGPGGPMWRHML